MPTPKQNPTTAPQNVSISKVAQGYVINWTFSPAAAKALLGDKGPQLMQSSSSSIEEPPQGLFAAMSQLSNSYSNGAGASGADSGSSSSSKILFVTEYREKNGSWQSLPLTKERSQLLKDIKPGTEYTFRVVALTEFGARSAPSTEFTYLVPSKCCN